MVQAVAVRIKGVAVAICKIMGALLHRRCKLGEGLVAISGD